MMKFIESQKRKKKEKKVEGGIIDRAKIYMHGSGEVKRIIMYNYYVITKTFEK